MKIKITRIKFVIFVCAIPVVLLGYLAWFLPEILIKSYFPEQLSNISVVEGLAGLKWSMLLFIICAGVMKVLNVLMGKDVALNTKLDKIFGKK